MTHPKPHPGTRGTPKPRAAEARNFAAFELFLTRTKQSRIYREAARALRKLKAPYVPVPPKARKRRRKK